MPILPQDIGNRAIDLLPGAQIIGAMTDGSRESEALRRIYGPTLRQLLRGAHWSFARKSAPLQLLADATGQTLDPASGLPISTIVEQPWTYAYAWPIDGVRPRWMPWQWGTPVTSPPPAANLNVTPPGNWRPPPAPFLVSTSDQYPIVTGPVDWTNMPDLAGTEGVGLTGRRIVLCNVQNAVLVYTRLVTEIELWDELFAEGMVQTLASKLALPLVSDRKLALTLRAQHIAAAKDAVANARVASGNEAGFPQSVNREAPWIAGRRSGAPWNAGPWGYEGPGTLYYGWESINWADGSVM